MIYVIKFSTINRIVKNIDDTRYIFSLTTIYCRKRFIQNIDSTYLDTYMWPLFDVNGKKTEIKKNNNIDSDDAKNIVE